MVYGKVPNTTAGTSSTSVSYHRSEVLDDEGYVHRGSRLTQLERHRFFFERFAKGDGFLAAKTPLGRFFCWEINESFTIPTKGMSPFWWIFLEDIRGPVRVGF